MFRWRNSSSSESRILENSPKKISVSRHSCSTTIWVKCKRLAIFKLNAVISFSGHPSYDIPYYVTGNAVLYNWAFSISLPQTWGFGNLSKLEKSLCNLGLPLWQLAAVVERKVSRHSSHWSLRVMSWFNGGRTRKRLLLPPAAGKFKRLFKKTRVFVNLSNCSPAPLSPSVLPQGASIWLSIDMTAAQPVALRNMSRADVRIDRYLSVHSKLHVIPKKEKVTRTA